MKVMILGVSPLPSSDSPVVMGPGIRTWQFTEPLLKQGHQVQLVCLRPKGFPIKVAPPSNRNLEYHEISQEQFLELHPLRRLEKEFNPDCIMSASVTLTAYAAVQLNPEKPVWVDQFGDPMAEAQVKSHVDGINTAMLGYWRYVKLALDYGDCFSAVSSRNRYSLLGELASRGRLNLHTVGYEFVYEIPCGVDDRLFAPQKSVLSKYGVNKDDFVVLWSGGYNTWSDVETLFSGLELAMAQCQKLHFVSTGQGIPHHSIKNYPWFVEAIKQSKFKNRYHLLGWIPHSQLESIYQESHSGINCDRFCYEAELGSRNRVLNWLKAGLAIATTNLTELTQTLQENGLLYSFAVGDPKALGDCFVELYKKRDHLRDLSEKRKEFVREHYSFDVTTQPLQDWVARPSKAPDHSFYSGRADETDHFYTMEAKYIQTLEGKLQSAKGENKIIKRLTQELKARDKKLTHVHQQMAKMSKEFEKQLKDRNKKQTQTYQQMGKTAKEFEAELKNREKKLAKAHQQIQSISKELGKKLRIKDEEIAGLNEKMRQLGIESDQKITEKNQEIGRLHGELAKLSEQIHHFMQAAEVAHFDKEKTELKLQEKERDVNALVEQVRGLNQEIIHRDKTIGTAYDELHQTKQRLHDQQEKIKFLEGEILRMRELVKVFRQELIVSDET